jgi:hypothetical protein
VFTHPLITKHEKKNYSIKMLALKTVNTISSSFFKKLSSFYRTKTFSLTLSFVSIDELSHEQSVKLAVKKNGKKFYLLLLFRFFFLNINLRRNISFANVFLWLSNEETQPAFVVPYPRLPHWKRFIFYSYIYVCIYLLKSNHVEIKILKLFNSY